MCPKLLTTSKNLPLGIKKALLSSVDNRTKAIGVIGFEPTASCSQSRRSSQAELHPGNSSAAAECLLSDVISEKTYHVHHKNYSTRSASVLQYNPAPAGGLDAGESIVGATRCGCPGQAHRPAPTVGSLR